MNQKTVLTPMQLFFCAKLMDAVYYDYAYLAAMPDVHKRSTRCMSRRRWRSWRIRE